MGAHLYQIKLHRSDADYPSAFEFIVVGDDPDKRAAKGEGRVAWYGEMTGRPVESVRLARPMSIENVVVTEEGETPIDWLQAQKRVAHQEQTRPRGTGCIFRVPSADRTEPYRDHDLNDHRASIEYFMTDHRKDGESYLFVGSDWKRGSRSRVGDVNVFEAATIELAADLVQLRFLTRFPRTTLTEWCGHIFVV